MIYKIFSLTCFILLLMQTSFAHANEECAAYIPTAGIEDFTRAEQYFTGVAQEKPNYHQAYLFFKRAASQGHAIAHLRLGHIYAEKHFTDTPYDLKKAEEHFQIAAKKNANDALFRMGNFYLQYLDPPQIDNAIFWLSKAANCNHATAQFDLARLYTNHDPANKRNEILSLLNKAGENNNRQAQEMLARFYLKGYAHVTEADPDKMAYWAEKLTAEKFASIFWIETLAEYYDARGNIDKAQLLWQRAAKKNSPKAKQRLKLINND